jgi:hypothetical protein
MTEQTALDLSGRDIGTTIQFAIGGATYRGMLTELQFSVHADARRGTRVMLVVRAEGGWRAIKFVEGDHPVTVEAPEATG